LLEDIAHEDARVEWPVLGVDRGDFGDSGGELGERGAYCQANGMGRKGKEMRAVEEEGQRIAEWSDVPTYIFRAVGWCMVGTGG
jgi:hypothetical protein